MSVKTALVSARNARPSESTAENPRTAGRIASRITSYNVCYTKLLRKREDPRDIVILRPGVNRWEDLPIGGRIGTSSLRRKAMLLHSRPDLKMLDIRGNVETRIRKLTVITSYSIHYTKLYERSPGG